MSSSRAACSSTRMSSAIGARVRPLSFGVSASDACSAPTEKKSSVGVAPLQHLDRLERVAFERLHQLGLERRAAAGGAEGAVAGGAAGAAGDLGELGRIELAELVAVELAVGGERDVIDVEIEAHADGVGGDQVVDVARTGRARPARCGCAATARRARRRRRRAGGGSARRWRRPPRPRTRRWRSGAAAA